jgi:hypothetical protein
MQDSIIVLVDGSSTCVVLQDQKYCANVRPANINIKVGKEGGKSGIVKYGMVGDFSYRTRANGVTYTKTVLARIVPGFGVNIIPECLYLEDGCSVVKNGARMAIYNTDKKQVLTANAKKYDDTWLFYAEVEAILVNKSDTTNPQEPKNISHNPARPITICSLRTCTS